MLNERKNKSEQHGRVAIKCLTKCVFFLKDQRMLTQILDVT